MESKIKVAIDISWIRHGVVGGTESYALNLISGFASLKDESIDYYLIVSKNNLDLVEKYRHFFHIIVANVSSKSRIGRVAWQNLFLGKQLKKRHIDICIEPIYLKPLFGVKKIRFITTIHDLQAIHYPEYFSKSRVKWMKFWWRKTVKHSKYIIVTSDYVRKDIVEKLGCDPQKIILNYDPVTIDSNNVENEKWLESKMNLKKENYYYIASSLLPHKNIETPLKALAYLKNKGSDKCLPIAISGVGGKNKGVLEQLIKDLDISNLVTITPFLAEKERNALYKYAKAYFAPSLFEGFGMTPIEAMIFGTPVISTKETCSFEITGGLANYVDNPKSFEEWASIIENGIKPVDKIKFDELFSKYTKESVANIFNNTVKTLVNEE